MNPHPPPDPRNERGATAGTATPQVQTTYQMELPMQDTTKARPDARTIHRRRLALLVLSNRYGSDPNLAAGAARVAELVRQRGVRP